MSFERQHQAQGAALQRVSPHTQPLLQVAFRQNLPRSCAPGCHWAHWGALGATVPHTGLGQGERGQLVGLRSVVDQHNPINPAEVPSLSTASLTRGGPAGGTHAAGTAARRARGQRARGRGEPRGERCPRGGRRGAARIRTPSLSPSGVWQGVGETPALLPLPMGASPARGFGTVTNQSRSRRKEVMLLFLSLC